MTIEEKLAEMGLVLPAKRESKAIFVPVRIVGNIAYISGHGPLNANGSVTEKRGKVGVDLTVEEGKEQAQMTMLAILASLKATLGDLERVKAWIKLLGMVNCPPDFAEQPSVINGASELIIALWGEERGAHTRAAVGMGSLPGQIPVEIEAMVEIE
ncbi:MAG: RidA family protein [Chloroflexota bacterium]